MTVLYEPVCENRSIAQYLQEKQVRNLKLDKNCVNALQWKNITEAVTNMAGQVLFGLMQHPSREVASLKDMILMVSRGGEKHVTVSIIINAPHADAASKQRTINFVGCVVHTFVVSFPDHDWLEAVMAMPTMQNLLWAENKGYLKVEQTWMVFYPSELFLRSVASKHHPLDPVFNEEYVCRDCTCLCYCKWLGCQQCTCRCSCSANNNCREICCVPGTITREHLHDIFSSIRAEEFSGIPSCPAPILYSPPPSPPPPLNCQVQPQRQEI